MTPDEYWEKYGDIKDKETVNCNKCDKGHNDGVTEKHEYFFYNYCIAGIVKIWQSCVNNEIVERCEH